MKDTHELKIIAENNKEIERLEKELMDISIQFQYQMERLNKEVERLAKHLFKYQLPEELRCDNTEIKEKLAMFLAELFNAQSFRVYSTTDEIAEAIINFLNKTEKGQGDGYVGTVHQDV